MEIAAAIELEVADFVHVAAVVPDLHEAKARLAACSRRSRGENATNHFEAIRPVLG